MVCRIFIFMTCEGPKNAESWFDLMEMAWHGTLVGILGDSDHRKSVIHVSRYSQKDPNAEALKNFVGYFEPLRQTFVQLLHIAEALPQRAADSEALVARQGKDGLGTSILPTPA